MYWWRVTKYNPENRDGQGAYLLDEWTDFSEVGRKFSGKVFTLVEYLEMESLYVNAVLAFVECLKVDNLTIYGLEKHVTLKKRDPLSAYLYPLYEKKNGQNIRREEIANYVRLILRNFLWCKLKNLPFMEVHFGYDYYMYIGSAKPCYEVHEKIEQSGLFIEYYLSPYI